FVVYPSTASGYLFDVGMGRPPVLARVTRPLIRDVTYLMSRLMISVLFNCDDVRAVTGSGGHGLALYVASLSRRSRGPEKVQAGGVFTGVTRMTSWSLRQRARRSGGLPLWGRRCSVQGRWPEVRS